MKKFLVLILMVFCFAAAGFAKTYNVKSNNDSIKLNKSDILVIELQENASTGFSWEMKSTDENIVKIIDKKTVYPKPKIGQPPLCGQSGTAIYKIKALNVGSAKIQGAYRRPWEDRPPINDYNLNITVE
ncbi:MAG: protease inhibitor I42 family protein [bacterium]|nr:protease inhibitor I42 family protein [bacterium]